MYSLLFLGGLTKNIYKYIQVNRLTAVETKLNCFAFTINLQLAIDDWITGLLVSRWAAGGLKG